MPAYDALCRLCRRTTGANTHNWMDHHTQTSLKISSAKGCRICRLLFLTFCKQPSEDLGRCEKLRIARLHNDSVSVKGFNDAIQRFEVFGPG